MLINKIKKDPKKKFVFVLRKPDGSEYDKAVIASDESDAERRLRNVLDIFYLRDIIIKLNKPSSW